MHTCTHTHMHTCTLAHLHTCTHVHMYTCTHEHVFTCTLAHLHTCTHAHMHTCTHAHTHTCTPSPRLWASAERLQTEEQASLGGESHAGLLLYETCLRHSKRHNEQAHADNTHIHTQHTHIHTHTHTHNQQEPACHCDHTVVMQCQTLDQDQETPKKCHFFWPDDVTTMEIRTLD